MIKVISVFLCFCCTSLFAQDRITEVIARINQVRRSHGIGEVTVNPMLTKAARYQAEWMAKVNRMEHLREQPSSFEDFKNGFYHPVNRVVHSGYFAFDELFRTETVNGAIIAHPLPAANEKIGEIIAKGWGGHDSGSPERVVTGWMNSPLGHGKEILNKRREEIGVWVASFRPGEYYWCAVFACR